MNQLLDEEIQKEITDYLTKVSDVQRPDALSGMAAHMLMSKLARAALVRDLELNENSIQLIDEEVEAWTDEAARLALKQHKRKKS